MSCTKKSKDLRKILASSFLVIPPSSMKNVTRPYEVRLGYKPNTPIPKAKYYSFYLSQPYAIRYFGSLNVP